MISFAVCGQFRVSLFLIFTVVAAKTYALLVIFIGDPISFQIIPRLFAGHYQLIIKMEYSVHQLLLCVLQLIQSMLFRCLLKSLQLNHLFIFNLSSRISMIGFGSLFFSRVMRINSRYLVFYYNYSTPSSGQAALLIHFEVVITRSS